MPRNISPASLAQLRELRGGEPICLVKIQWSLNGQWFWYADRFIAAFPAEGRILELSGLENVVKISGNNRSQAATIKLDDSDGALKNIIDYNDIHKRSVLIYQWFLNLPASEAFIIFQGEISSPITWKEGDRTLSFEVIERIEDIEVGFSIESGQFDFIPEEFVGKALPLGFGTNIRVPSLQINTPPVGLTKHPIGFSDPSLHQKINQNALKIGNLQNAIWLAAFYAGECAMAAFMMEDTADQLQKTVDGIESADASLAKVDETSKNTDQNFDDTAINPGSTYTAPAVARINDVVDPNGPPPDEFGFFDEDNSFQATEYTPKSISSDGSVGQIRDIGSNVQGITQRIVDKTKQRIEEDKTDIEAMKAQISNLRSQAKTMKSEQHKFESQERQLADQKVKIEQDNIKLGETLEKHNTVGQITGVIRGNEFPRGAVRVKIGNVEAAGSFAGDTFIPAAVILNPEDKRPKNRIPPIDEHIEKGKFVVINPGATVKLISDFPIYYIVNLLPSVIHEVLAKRVVNGGAAILTPVPANYYSVEQIEFTNIGDPTLSYNTTVIVLHRGLSTYDEGWQDQIYVSFTSPIGPNTVDIMIWLIEFYTKHTLDPLQFANVRERVEPYPSHFVLIQRKNILSLLEEMAFQARLAVWLDNGVFKIKYLPDLELPVDTIGEDDIQFGTMEIGHTRTEDIVTKFTAKYKFNHEDKEPNIIVLRYNIPKYGTLEKNYDYYIYNGSSQVYLSAAFWLIRKANTYKILKIKTFLNKLNLETMDTVLLNFSRPWISNGPVLCTVESCKYDSESNTVDLEILTPVRLGEMDAYDYYYPSQLSAYTFFPNNEEVDDGTVGDAQQAAIVGDIPGSKGFTSVVNFPHDTPNRTSRPRDFGPKNVSDNRNNEPFQIPQYEQGTVVAPNITPGVAQIRQLEGVPDLVVGDKISTKEGDAVIAGIVDLANEGFTKLKKVIFNIPLILEAGAALLKGLDKADDIRDPLNPDDYNDYKYRDYITTETPDLNPPDPQEIATEDGTGVAVPIKIVSGTGNTYKAIAYMKGTDKPGEKISVTVLQIDSTETIPQNTWLIGVKVKQVDDDNNVTYKWYCQPPIWMGSL